jgi:hypothetical protein
MTSEESEFLYEATTAIESGESQRLSDAVSRFSAFCFKETPSPEEAPSFSSDFVDSLLGLIGSRTFLEMEDSFPLLAFFQSDWGRLDQEQRIRVCQHLASIYDKLRDDTATLVAAELLGEYLANDAALELLKGLRGASREVPRANIVHGLKCLALAATDKRLSKEAISTLTAMSNDSSAIVRAEAAAAIDDISRAAL